MLSKGICDPAIWRIDVSICYSLLLVLGFLLTGVLQVFKGFPFLVGKLVIIKFDLSLFPLLLLREYCTAVLSLGFHVSFVPFHQAIQVSGASIFFYPLALTLSL